MKKNILLLAIGLLLAACGRQEKQQDAASADSKYRTTAPSLLYFKNMRSAYYEHTEQPGTRIGLYRLRKFSQAAPEATLVPVIANNWLKDEAYILLETSGPALATPLTIRWTAQDDSGIYELKPANADMQYKIALQLYESLQAGHQLSALAADSTWTPVLEGEGLRSHYSATIRDYLRLTEAL